MFKHELEGFSSICSGVFVRLRTTLYNTFTRVLTALEIKYQIEDLSFEYKNGTGFMIQHVVSGRFLGQHILIAEIICRGNTFGNLRINLMSNSNNILTFRIAELTDISIKNSIQELVEFADKLRV